MVENGTASSGASHFNVAEPNAARIYDYLLGGTHHRPVDRALAEEMVHRSYRVMTGARENRACLGRMVAFCVQYLGISQFLDLGSGIPALGSVHEIAHRHDPAARVAYVDHDPDAVAIARDITAGLSQVRVTCADLRDPVRVLTASGVGGLLDLRQPVAVLMAAVLHFVPNRDDPAEIVAVYRDALSSGSAVALTHAASDGGREVEATVSDVSALFSHTTHTAHPRSRRQVTRLLGGLELVAPGLVDIVDWNPRQPPPWPPPPSAGGYAGLGTVRW